MIGTVARGNIATAVEEDIDLHADTVSVNVPGGQAEPEARAVKNRQGMQVGGYALERLLGAGGMGEVWAVSAIGGGPPLALKLLSGTSPTRLYRFKREFRALADVEHPNLIRLHELVVPADGQPYFTMELVDGESFVAWIRGGAPEGSLPDLERLSAAFTQLVAALDSLHRQGFVHRDVKPSNVLVDESGRVVVLDFGLVFDLDEPEHGFTRDGQLLGTPAYMAPEQVEGERAGPAADLYAVGVMLFESLTGRAPFEGSVLAMLAHKSGDHVPDPSAIVPDIPARLRYLCLGLLASHGDDRPSARTVLAQLAGEGDALGLEVSPRSPKPRTIERVDSGLRATGPFIGRARELEVLREALDASFAEQRLSLVHLLGASGLGKTALMRRLRAKLDETVMVLHGRCRERESMPYKGVDAVIDALSAQLRRLEPARIEALTPPDLDALVRVFPVLAELWPEPPMQILDLGELRSLAWNALRSLLVELGTQQPVLVHIDDFQWTDADSVELLRALIRGPQQPAMTLVLGYRGDASGRITSLRPESGESSATFDLVLGPLLDDEALSLARSLLLERGEQSATLERRAQALALRAGGNPLFISQMVLADDHGEDQLDLDALLTRRLDALAPAAREAVEVVALAGAPVSRKAVLALSHPDAAAELDGLVRAELLVGQGVLELAHERLRGLLLDGLPASRRAALHRAYGERLLAEHGPDAPGELLFSIVDHLDEGEGLGQSPTRHGAEDPPEDTQSGAGLEPGEVPGERESVGQRSSGRWAVALDALEPARRLELARLNCHAGERALSATAWDAAKRYFGYALALAEPWLDAARQGAGDARELCFEISLGHAQAWAMCAGAAADGAFDALAAWALSSAEFGEVAARRLAMLSLQDRPVELIAQARAALGRLGIPIPERPRLKVAKREVSRAWRVLGRASLEELRALQPVEDAHVKAQMDLLALALPVAVLVSRELYMVLAARYVQLLARHGLHERATYVLMALAYCVCVLGRARDAGGLSDRALALADHGLAPAESLFSAKVVDLLFVHPRCRPLRDSLAHFAPTHARACELGQWRAASYLAVVGTGFLLDVGDSLDAGLAYLDHAQARQPELGGEEYRKIAVVHRSYARSLREGVPVIEAEVLDPLYRLTQLNCVVVEVCAAILLGDLERAHARAQTIYADYDSQLRGSWNLPRFAMLHAILLGDRLRATKGLERLGLYRELRRCRLITREYERDCPENYTAMRAIVDAEIAVGRGRDDAAAQAYELARRRAEAQSMHCVAGLASERLAALYRRRGHGLAEQAAREAAVATYRGWGALAVVARLEGERSVG
nr:serine/threonine-protein kinase [Pseudenhygromyxa sp. WMMC2535]